MTGTAGNPVGVGLRSEHYPFWARQLDEIARRGWALSALGDTDQGIREIDRLADRAGRGGVEPDGRLRPSGP